jgi:superoxide dismutase
MARETIRARLRRREFLALITLLAAGSWSGCSDGQRVLQPEEEDAELTALRLAARRPGRVGEAIRRMTPAPLRQPKPLPFDPKQTSPFSDSTHHLHFEHHYLEYFHRWVHRERSILELAAKLGTEDGDLLLGQARIRSLHETMRASACLVVLHEVYWRGLWKGQLRSLDIDAAMDPPPESVGFTVVDQNADVLAIPNGPSSVPYGMQPIAVVDWQSHAWRLDFPTRQVYAEAVVLHGDERLAELVVENPNIQSSRMEAKSREN